MSATGSSLNDNKTKTNKQANHPSNVHDVTWHPATEVLKGDVFLPFPQASYWSTNSDREYTEPHIKKKKKNMKERRLVIVVTGISSYRVLRERSIKTVALQQVERRHGKQQY